MKLDKQSALLASISAIAEITEKKLTEVTYIGECQSLGFSAALQVQSVRTFKAMELLLRNHYWDITIPLARGIFEFSVLGTWLAYGGPNELLRFLEDHAFNTDKLLTNNSLESPFRDIFDVEKIGHLRLEGITGEVRKLMEKRGVCDSSHFERSYRDFYASASAFGTHAKYGTIAPLLIEVEGGLRVSPSPSEEVRPPDDLLLTTFASMYIHAIALFDGLEASCCKLVGVWGQLAKALED